MCPYKLTASDSLPVETKTNENLAIFPERQTGLKRPARAHHSNRITGDLEITPIKKRQKAIQPPLHANILFWDISQCNDQAYCSKEIVMEINDYCKNVNMELTVWKAKLYDVISKIERLPTSDKQRMYEEVNGLHIIMAELDERIEKLRTECPIEWKPAQEEIKVKLSSLSNKYNDTAGVLFDYDIGG